MLGESHTTTTTKTLKCVWCVRCIFQVVYWFWCFIQFTLQRQRQFFGYFATIFSIFNFNMPRIKKNEIPYFKNGCRPIRAPYFLDIVPQEKIPKLSKFSEPQEKSEFLCFVFCGFMSFCVFFTFSNATDEISICSFCSFIYLSKIEPKRESIFSVLIELCV